MGWFESELFPNCEIGDQPLDHAVMFLDALRDAYVEDHGRKPTLAELQATLCLAIGRLGGRWIDELDGKMVVSMALKTKSAPKRQEFGVGDIFVIPLTAGDFSFCRFLYDGKERGGLIEVFAEVLDRPAFRDTVVESGRLGAPLWISKAGALESGEFPRLRSDPGFEPEGLEALEFLGGPPHAYKVMRIDGTVLRPLGAKEFETWKGCDFVLRVAHNVLYDVERRLGRRNADGTLSGAQTKVKTKGKSKKS